MLVDVVGDHEVNVVAKLVKAAERGEKALECLCVEPVVGVDVLEVRALGHAHSRHHGLAVTAVLLVNRTDDVGIALGPLVCLLGGVILGGAIVHNHNLDVLGIAGPLKYGGDALVHVGCRVVAGDAKGDGLLHVGLPS